MATDYFALAADLARREFHPCGRCSRPAAFVDRSVISGGVLFACFACDPQGTPTLVFPAVSPMAASGVPEDGQ